jgi:anionic cell wall polymer biosynthesis LytR-Cps2A-Psr (LCP) family protein
LPSLRLLIGCLCVLAASAATTTVFLRGQLGTLASDLSQHTSLKIDSGALATAGFGGPQTLLLVGNDQRKHTTTTPVLPHANEMLLVRLDSGKPWISMMSIPRELEVPIDTPDDGVVTTRLNAALFYGGINLLVATIKQVTGLSATTSS